ncbi:exo-beta-N-acetylmuramidase NamZ family protein [Salininema proteolyticum]|uniref:Exo-beta-N-acetylmuramidase NamZ domain-containing protein n=1 Tax=Salininema proteolyticum TaxID=1607685 RepID=A0ABV8U5C7_9ACTN
MKRRNLFITSAAAAGTAVIGPSAPARARGPKVKTGIEVLARDGFRELSGQRVGMISNPTGVLPDLTHEVDLMHQSGKVDIAAVYGPEHGFRGTSQAGEGEDFFTDPRTGLPVYNAYNDRDQMADLLEQAGVETVVFDIQDVGSRFYTYIWTMYLVLEAAASLGLRFVVLDRPNPITGTEATGPVLHEENATFVGLKPIAQRHGMTVGELATLFNARFVPEAVGDSADLTVVRMEGWKRSTPFDRTGLPWVAPSPNMPTPGTAELYPGTCLFEATALSEGRGTTQPFQLLGAPELDHEWALALNRLGLSGVGFREAYFKPVFSKWAGEVCGGAEVQTDAPHRADPIRTALAMILEQRRLFPQYGWRSQDGGGSYWLDKLTGNTAVRLAVEAGAPLDEVESVWAEDLAAFRELRAEHLLYGED